MRAAKSRIGSDEGEKGLDSEPWFIDIWSGHFSSTAWGVKSDLNASLCIEKGLLKKSNRRGCRAFSGGQRGKTYCSKPRDYGQAFAT